MGIFVQLHWLWKTRDNFSLGITTVFPIAWLYSNYRKGTPSNEQDIEYQYILILNGDYKGEIWRINKTTMRPIYNTEMLINVLTIMEAIAYGGL